MYKLLKAGLFRLRREMSFWLFIFLSFGIAIFILFKGFATYNEVMIEKLINEFTLYIGIFIAIFVSMFVGKEHSEGIIRNKIIVRT